MVIDVPIPFSCVILALVKHVPFPTALLPFSSCIRDGPKEQCVTTSLFRPRRLWQVRPGMC